MLLPLNDEVLASAGLVQGHTPVLVGPGHALGPGRAPGPDTPGHGPGRGPGHAPSPVQSPGHALRKYWRLDRQREPVCSTLFCILFMYVYLFICYFFLLFLRDNRRSRSGDRRSRSGDRRDGSQEPGNSAVKDQDHPGDQAQQNHRGSSPRSPKSRSRSPAHRDDSRTEPMDARSRSPSRSPAHRDSRSRSRSHSPRENGRLDGGLQDDGQN